LIKYAQLNAAQALYGPIPMPGKPTYLILVATQSLRHPEFIYEMNHVPMGTPFEWCCQEKAHAILQTRAIERPQFSYQLRYVAD
jgi:hypothetical protein